MPIFLPDSAFDRDSMDEAQRRNFDAATQTFNTVQRTNAKREYDDLPPDADEQVKGFVIAMGAYHRPGPKSALFHRLLSGKAPLPYAPPTSFSYPWYDVIESPGPFPVMVEGIDSSQDERGDPSPTIARRLILNQCAWDLDGMNDAARALEAFLHDPATASLSLEAWSAQTQERLKEGPEWRVHCGPWSGFRVFMGRRRVQRRREDFLNTTLRFKSLEGANPVLLQVIQPWQDAHDERLKKRDAIKTKPEHQRTVQERHALISVSEVPPFDPLAWDWVDVEEDGWNVERTSAFSIPE